MRAGISAVGFREEYKAIQDRAAGNRKAIDDYFNKTTENQRGYAGLMSGANDIRLTDLRNAANKGADIASKGARDGYGAVVGGYNQGYNLALQANEAKFGGTVKAAEKVWNAAVEAARLQAVASIINSVGHNVARNIEQGMTLRY